MRPRIFVALFSFGFTITMVWLFSLSEPVYSALAPTPLQYSSSNCNSTTPNNPSCSPHQCGQYESLFITGDGLSAVINQDVNCSGGSQTCPDPVSSQTAVPNNVCCDKDNDGYYRSGCTSTNVDCNDNDSNINPGASEYCFNNKDDNCDGVTDADPEDCDTGNCPDTCMGPADYCYWPSWGCPPWLETNGPCCYQPSPIVIDVVGNGFNLTNASNGVLFDIGNNGIRDQIAWTAQGSDDAWLVLDRNSNGVIDNGTELFGNFAPQPASTGFNGFNALAEYDKPANGGNNDGRISSGDSVFSSLRLWQDANHNGVSESNELSTLSSAGLASIDLKYKESRRIDENGNQFKYRAKVKDAKGAQLGRWAWDVFLVKQ